MKGDLLDISGSLRRVLLALVLLTLLAGEAQACAFARRRLASVVVVEPTAGTTAEPTAGAAAAPELTAVIAAEPTAGTAAAAAELIGATSADSSAPPSPADCAGGPEAGGGGRDEPIICRGSAMAPPGLVFNQMDASETDPTEVWAIEFGTYDIYRWNGAVWERQEGKGVCVTVGKYGVFVVGLDYGLYQWANASSTWVSVPTPWRVKWVSSGNQLWVVKQDDNALYWKETPLDFATEYVGCYADSWTRDLPDLAYWGPLNSPQRCTERCSSLGYLYAGVQNSQECRCGNYFGRMGVSNFCAAPCPTDPAVTCGGLWANNIYKASAWKYQGNANFVENSLNGEVFVVTSSIVTTFSTPPCSRSLLCLWCGCPRVATASIQKGPVYRLNPSTGYFETVGSIQGYQVAQGPSGLWMHDGGALYYHDGRDWRLQNSEAAATPMSGGCLTSGASGLWVTSANAPVAMCQPFQVCEPMYQTKPTPAVTNYIDTNRDCFFQHVKSLVPLYQVRAADFLRLNFHDCGAGACDASLIFNAERDHPKNARLEGFPGIIAIQASVQMNCSFIPSFADTIQVAAAVMVWASQPGGGREGDVLDLQYNPAFKLGRPDNIVPNNPDQLPTVLMPLPALISSFKTIFNTDDDAFAVKLLTVLSGGGHTIGDATCATFNERRDPSSASIDLNFRSRLRLQCPQEATLCTKVPLDAASERVFDNAIFKALQQQKGVLSSDQVLYSGGDWRMSSLVDEYAKDGTGNDKFLADWVEAYIYMGKNGVPGF